MFLKVLQFQKVIVMCYKAQIVVKVIKSVPPPLIWHISQIIMNYFSHVILSNI
jgi:hypothetical protein